MSERKPLRLPVPEARKLRAQKQALIVDVVGTDVYENVSYAIKDARRMNPDRIEETFHQLPRKRPILTYCTCENDEISARIAYFLRKQAYEAYAIAGGLDAWREAGYPIEEKVASRQEEQTERM